MTFYAAFHRLPMCVVGNFDALTHKTVADLRYIVQHELDMFREGQETDILTKRDERLCRKFLADTE
jgi:hypothetical protein